MTYMALGLSNGIIHVYSSKHLFKGQVKHQQKQLDKKEKKSVKLVRRGNQVDLYVSNDDCLISFDKITIKNKIVNQRVQVCDVSSRGTLMGAIWGDNKMICEYDMVRCIGNYGIEGEKVVIKCFKESYVAIVTISKKSNTEKYTLQILDTTNKFISCYEEFSKIQHLIISHHNIHLIVRNAKDQRLLIKFTEKDNAFKIQTFFRKSYFNQAWRFAKNQSCEPNLLAQISRHHGDLLYTKGNYEGAIKQYIMTLGFVQPAYVIKKFLDVVQIQYLIEYLQAIHQKNLAEKQHTGILIQQALLLNCYVKQRKIQELSKFLNQSTFDCNLFDIQTAIKVCRQLNHTQLAIKLAQQKKQHQYYLRILIEDKKDFARAIEYIRFKVQDILDKQNYLLQFGQQLIEHNSRQTINLIQKLVLLGIVANNLKQKSEMKAQISQKHVKVINYFGIKQQQRQMLETATFRHPQQFLRIFLINSTHLQSFLKFLVSQSKSKSDQIIYHRLFEFYLEQYRDAKDSYASPGQIEKIESSIMSLLEGQKRYDKNHMMVLFKMYEFDKGIIYLYQIMQMREQLLMHYINIKQDDKIMQLCIDYGELQYNLWIQGIKYFCRGESESKRLPVLLSKLQNHKSLSPLLVLSILKSKNIEYKYIKQYFLSKMKSDFINITRQETSMKNNTKRVNQSLTQYNKLKSMAKTFQSTRCNHCQNQLTLPSLHFMCGHSFHQNCLSGQRQCSKCSFDIKSIIERKSKFDEQKNDQNKLFQALQQKRAYPFQAVCQFIGKGLFPNEILKRK